MRLFQVSTNHTNISKQKKRSRKTFCALSLALLLVQPLHAAAELWEVYMKTLKDSWNLINLDKAYQANPDINGSGVSVGIVDTAFNKNHPSLFGKDNWLINSDCCSGGNLEEFRHGSHVAGIILGNKLSDDEPHGIAYNGKYYGIGFIHPRGGYEGNLYDDLKNTGVKIVNNSWASNDWFPTMNIKNEKTYTFINANGSPITAEQYFNDIMGRELNNNKPHQSLDLMRLSQEYDMLNVVATSNDSMIAPAASAVIPTYNEDVRAWIIVGALDAENIVKDETTGQITIKSGKCTNSNGQRYECHGVAQYSNAFKSASLYGISAPGSNIISANAFYNDSNPFLKPEDKEKYWAMSGTSMATPMVTGAAMLVAQKYGFLGGAQIADVLLTTANKDYKLPKIVIKNFNNGGFYNIIYTGGDEQVPRKDGKVDKNQVKQDLMNELNYTEEEADKILANLFQYKDPTTGQNNDSLSIVGMTKEEIMGQGILDVDKALKGLATLDANRLNKKDIETFENEKQAFYTINTKGMSGDFSNDINQKTWDNALHLEGALNSPKEEMQNISKVGLLKTGAGKLTLSGENSYKGATRVNQGDLELSNTGKLTQSDVYAEYSGRFVLSGGEVNNNATARNGGTIYVQNSSEIKGTTTASHGGVIQLGLENALGANIAAAALNRATPITLTTKEVKLESNGILAGFGKIQGEVNNTSGIVMAGYGLSISNNLTSQNVLEISGKYTQESDGTLSIAFNGDSSNKNSQIKADSYDIKGGTLEFRPTYNGEGSRLTAGEQIKLDLGDLKNKTNNFTTIKTQETNSLKVEYNKDTQTLTTQMKENAFQSSNPESSSISNVLKEIAQQTNLSQKYDNFFGYIDIADNNTYQANIDSIASNTYLYSLEESFYSQQQNTISSFVNLMDSVTPMNNARIANNARKFINSTMYQAALASNNASRFIQTASYNENDYCYTETLDEKGREKCAKLISSKNDKPRHTLDAFLDSKDRAQVSVKTDYTYLKANSYKSNAYGLNVQGKYKVLSNLVVGGFASFGNVSQSGGGAITTNRFSFGGNAIYNTEYIDVFGGLGFGVGINNASSILANGSSIGSSFTNYLLSTQVGVGKEFQFANLSLYPAMIFNHTAIIQDSFNEKGVLFAKSYAGGTHNVLGLSLGGTIQYMLNLDEWDLYFRGFGFYTPQFMTNIENKANFIDFPEYSFTQRQNISANSGYIGVSTQANYDRYFGSVSLTNGIGTGYYWITLSLQGGMSF